MGNPALNKEKSRWGSAKGRLEALESALRENRSVTDVCREYEISRKTYYKWKKRYEEAAGDISALSDKEQTYPRLTPPEIVQQLIDLILQNPEYSSRTISKLLPRKFNGKPLLSEHGVRKVLKRLNLSHIEDRKRYMERFAPKPAIAPAPRFIPLPRWLVDLPQLTHLPPPFNRIRGITLPSLSFVFNWFLGRLKASWLLVSSPILLITLSSAFAIAAIVLTRNLLASQNTIHGKVGILFSEVSLVAGFFFFLYSMKYYFTLAMVLAYSRQKGIEGSRDQEIERLRDLENRENKIQNGNKNHRLGSGLLRKVNGFVNEIKNGNGIRINSVNSDELGWRNHKNGNGLNLNTDHQDLEELSDPANQPFISIHLPLYNEKRVVERVIRACAQQDYQNFEVIVIDDSTDETTGIAERVAKEINERVGKEMSNLKPQNSNPHVECQKLGIESERWDRVRVLHRPTRQGFKGGALGYALENVHPQTEYIMVFDADFVPFPDTIKQFLRYFKLTTGKVGGWREELRKKKEEIRKEKESNIHNSSFLIHNSNPIAAICGYQSSSAQQAELRKDKVARAEQIPESNIAAICGYQWHVLNKNENWITRGVRTEYSGSYIIERSGQELLGLMKLIHGSVYMIRRDALEDEGIGWGTSITEDFELTLKLYAKGYKVVYTPYIQAPSECVSTLKRLIRQRMRWSEGHSHCVRRMFKKLMFGAWEIGDKSRQSQIIPNYSNYTNPPDGEAGYSKGAPSTKSQKIRKTIGNWNIRHYLGQPARSAMRSVAGGLGTIRSIRNSESEIGNREETWIPSPLTFREKLEFLYLSPYYLQSALFMIGNLAWLVSEAVFHIHLPYWTELWGWSLVFTNMLSLPLINSVGLFIEESDSRDYLGLLSFVILCYLLTPFQAYASIKGFLEPEEGTWFRTPKTGVVTIDVVKGTFSRLFGFLGVGRKEFAPAVARLGLGYLGTLGGLRGIISMEDAGENPLNQRPAFETAGNQFHSFKIKPNRIRWASKIVLASLLAFSVSLYSIGQKVPFAYATETWPNLFLRTTTNACSPSEDMINSAGSSTSSKTYDTAGQENCWYSPSLPTEGGDGNTGAGPWSFHFDGSWGGGTTGDSLTIAVQAALVAASGCGSPSTEDTASVTFTKNTSFPVTYTITLTNNANTVITAASPKRIRVCLEVTAEAKTGQVTMSYNYTSGGIADSNLQPSTLTVPEKTVYLVAAAPLIPAVAMWLKKRKSLPLLI